MDLILTCPHCGHEMVVSEFALGSKGKCAGCGVVLTVLEDDTRPHDEGAPPNSTNAAIETHEPQDTGPLRDIEEAFGGEDVQQGPPAPPKSHCERCGRRFRGEWDSYETARGLLCHVCAHLATEDAPAAGSRRFDEPPADPDSYFPAEPVGQTREESEEDKLPQFARNHPKAFKGAIMGAGLFVVFLCFYFAMFGESAPPPRELTDEQVAELSERLPEGIGVVYRILQGAFRLLAVMGTLYLILLWQDKLFSNSFWLNLLGAIPYAAVLAGVGLLSSIFGGGLFLGLLFFLCWLIALYFVLIDQLECSPSAFLLYIPASFFAGIFADWLAAFAYGLLGIMFF